MQNDLHTAAWEISWLAPDRTRRVNHYGHNPIADYRDHVSPDAISREMVYRDDAEAEIAALRADAERFRELNDGEIRVDYTRRPGESVLSCEIDSPECRWTRRKDLRTAIDASRAAK